tara:strand:- start:8954 stop:9397 length:444 start_codon:yes stop_codon:yes gene_type:complete
MARLSIDLPEHLPFRTELSLHVSHMNPGGHLDNAQVFVLWAEARRRFFEALGYRQDNVEGLNTTVTDNAAVYRSEGFVGEVLTFHVGTGDFNKYGCDIYWQAFERLSGREVASGKNGFVFLQAGTRKVSPIPEAFVARCKAIEQQAN